MSKNTYYVSVVAMVVAWIAVLYVGIVIPMHEGRAVAEGKAVTKVYTEEVVCRKEKNHPHLKYLKKRKACNVVGYYK